MNTLRSEINRSFKTNSYTQMTTSSLIPYSRTQLFLKDNRKLLYTTKKLQESIYVVYPLLAFTS